MITEVKPKFQNGQKVYIVEDYIIKEGIIYSIQIDWQYLNSPICVYQLQKQEDIVMGNKYPFFKKEFYDEKIIFSSKEKLFEFLDKNTYTSATIKQFKDFK